MGDFSSKTARIGIRRSEIETKNLGLLRENGDAASTSSTTPALRIVSDNGCPPKNIPR